MKGMTGKLDRRLTVFQFSTPVKVRTDATSPRPQLVRIDLFRVRIVRKSTFHDSMTVHSHPPHLASFCRETG